MRVTGDVESTLAAVLADEQKQIQARLVGGMRAASAAVQAELRGQVRAAGLGQGLEKAWQKLDYPKQLSPAALVYSKSTILHAVFTDGAVITARNGRYLAIPTREAEALGLATSNTTRAGKGTGAIPRHVSQVQAAADKLGAKNLRTIPLQSGRKLIVYHVPAGRGAGLSFRGKVGFKRDTDVPLFILVPQVRLRPRLDVQGVRNRAGDILAAQITAALA